MVKVVPLIGSLGVRQETLSPPEQQDPDVGLVGDTSYVGTPGHAAYAELMENLLR